MVLNFGKKKKWRLEIRRHFILVTILVTVGYVIIWSVFLEEKAKLNHLLLSKQTNKATKTNQQTMKNQENIYLWQLFLMRKEHSPSRKWNHDNWKNHAFQLWGSVFWEFSKMSGTFWLTVVNWNILFHIEFSLNTQ